MPQQSLRILHLEDSPEDAELQNEFLRAEGFVVHSSRVQTPGDFQSELLTGGYDLILADNAMPGFDGLSALRIARQLAPDIPFIFVSGTIGEEIAIESLKNGATDYVLKDRLNRLVPVIHRALQEAEEHRERQRAETALHLTNIRLQVILDTSPVAILSADGEGRIQSWNKTAENLFGWTAEEVIGRVCPTVLPENMPDYLDMIRQVMQGETILRLVRHRQRKDGSIIDASISAAPQKDSSGQISGVTILLEDITQRRRMEEALRESEEYYRSLIENASDAITVIDANGVVLYESPAVERILGYKPEEFVGQKLADHIHPEDLHVLLSKITEALEHPGQIVAAEARFKHRDGSWRFVEAVGKTYLRPDGALTCVINSRDITERKQAQEKIQRQVAYLSALNEIDRAITSTFDMKLSLGLLLQKVRALLDVDAACVLLLDSQTLSLQYAAGQGFRTREFENKAPLQIGEGYAGRAALARTPMHITNLPARTDNPQLAPHLQSEGFLSYYGVPLIAKGEVKGVMELFDRGDFQPNTEQLDMINSLASLAAIAIHDVSMFNDLQRSNLELRMAYDATIEGWSRALDLRDRETEGHTKRVTEMTLQLARASGLDEIQLIYVRWGSLLHDIGKMGVPDHILLKPDKLTDEEWRIMKQHPQFAYDMLSSIRYLKSAIDIPYCHHEKWDGTGYPRGLKGAQIPLTARLFAVVDIWDALRSDRPYRSAWSKEKALEHIKSLSGSHLEPKVVELFLGLIGKEG